MLLAARYGPRMRKTTRPVDLRRAILDASLALVESEGVGGLSMREVTRRAGVTHGAPYHHFVDRAAILAAIADEGFALLTARMSAARARARTPRARFEACGSAYVTFAMENTAHFRVMYRPELASAREQPRLDHAASKGFELLVQCVKECQDAGVAPKGDPLPLVITSWSTAHGLAALWVDGPMSRGVKGVRGDPKRLVALVARTLGGLLEAAAHSATRAERGRGSRAKR